MDVLFAAVEPLVWTPEVYRQSYGEDDPEELHLMMLEDRDRAAAIAGALNDLFLLEVDLSRPREEEGPNEEVGPVEDLHALRAIAAEAAGFTPDDYYEGRAPAGGRFQHLINHDDTGGMYLPAHFLQPFWLGEDEDEDEENPPLSIGSAPALLRELEEVRAPLYARFPAEMAQAEKGEDAAAGPVRVWQVLSRLARAAVELDLPLVFG